MLHLKSFCFNEFGENCTLAWDETLEAIITDPGCNSASELSKLTDFISAKGLKIKYIALTHGHFDHIYGVSALTRLYGCPVLMDPADQIILSNNKYFCLAFGLNCPDTAFEDSLQSISDGEKICWGDGREWEVLSTPGHTPGGVCYLDREAKLLLSGDTLFAGAIGRTDNKWGDYDALIRGIFTKLMTLDGDIEVHPGHGHPTSIADERTKNPFLLPYNEPMYE